MTVISDREKLIELIEPYFSGYRVSDMIDNLISNGVTVQKHGKLGLPYLDEYFGQFADCKECGADNVLPCNYCRECGRKIDNAKGGY